jgi:class 3 adenylate cyclase
MKILDRVEKRVALPGDSETRRSQKVLGTVIIFFGSIAVLFNVISNLNYGLTTAAYIYLAWIGLLLLSGTLVLVYPRSWPLVVGLVTVGAVTVSFLTHIYSGGFQAGLETAPWMMIGPIGAGLFVGSGYAFLLLILTSLATMAAGYLEPYAITVAPELSLAHRVQIATGNVIVLGLIVTTASIYLLRQVENYRRRADDLLLNILPGSIALRLKESTETIADGYNEVTVLFADIVDFTSISSEADPVEVVNLLNEVFSEFDDLAKKYGLEKIKTIGDAYMVAAGLPEPRHDHAEAIMLFALDMLKAVEKYEGFQGEPINIRVGINTGPVVAGVIGRQKFIYDLWGDAVNVASRMESNGLANQIQVTRAVKEKLDGQYTFVEREPIYVKGKGTMVTYLLEGVR